ncbi:hypothetical protein GGS23DRAFT_593913 [Durotheca rogersii]|uniref:uncharacterized protein n=1 Tax=Durotheca rogersii TaxID=419775 RepID=UPI00221F982F|nr:uncharacterized protein GGS23DRAFT_593913 [Durotheca rogersii]KAI5865736.1 hypothetical protein GGS23DRAFT_593913 [Durotheca rogersii]
MASQDDEPAQAQSAEDRRTAAALASLDEDGPGSAAAASSSGAAAIDQAAVGEAVRSLGGAPAPAEPRKKVKVDAADVALLVDELDLPKARATELLKAHDGDAVQAMRAFVTA